MSGRGAVSAGLDSEQDIPIKLSLWLCTALAETRIWVVGLLPRATAISVGSLMKLSTSLLCDQRVYKVRWSKPRADVLRR